MKFIPILFSTEMVQAILAGRKTQTRRVIKPQPIDDNRYHFEKTDDYGDIIYARVLNKGITEDENNPPFYGMFKCLNGAKVGDVLWVRENFCAASHLDNQPISVLSQASEINYIADLNNENIPRFLNLGRTRPCIHMPKWACRIFLQIKDIRVERLQNISEKDAIDEGVEYLYTGNEGPIWRDYSKKPLEKHIYHPSVSFATLWQSINGENSWNSNPWVWVIEFERIEKPEKF